MKTNLFTFLQSNFTALRNQVKLANFPHLICFLFAVLISLASWIDETTIHMKIILLLTLLLETI